MKICRDSVCKLMSALFTIAAILYGCGTALAFVNAFSRKFLSVGIVWGEEMTTYLILMAFFLTIPYLELHNGSLCIGLLDSVIKNKTVFRYDLFA